MLLRSFKSDWISKFSILASLGTNWDTVEIYFNISRGDAWVFVYFSSQEKTIQMKSNQITFIVTSPQHKCLGEWNSYERAPDSAEKQQTIYLWTDSAKKTTDNLPMDRQCKKTTTDNLHMDRQCKKLHWSIYSAPDSAKKTTTAIYILDRQCKKATAIYIWTVHIYRLYRRQCAKYTYIYSVHIVYYKDTLNYQRHIHCMGTSALCTVSIHNVVYA